MRLTLRTMLAYLDDVLEPSDAHEIGRKIEENQGAANLVHRTRDLLRRPNLGAPRLSGKAAGLDANTVSEYLDNSLSSHRVADFERYCLESDVHLVEVAACHQVLALVLGEPADVEPNSRRRMYRILGDYEAHVLHKQTDADGPRASAPAGGDAGGADAATDLPEPAEAQPRRRKAEVPDYLRDDTPDGKTTLWRLAAAVLLLVLLICVVIMALGPKWLGMGDSPVAGSPGAVPADVDGPLDGDVNKGAKTTVDHGPDHKTIPPPTDNKDPLPPDHDPPDTLPKEKIDDPGKPPMDKSPKEKQPANGNKVGVEPKDPKVKSGGPFPKTATNVGQLLSPGTVLFLLDPNAGQWERMAPTRLLAAGDVLVSPPSNRNTLSLTGGINMHLASDSRIVLGPPKQPNGPPEVQLVYGRIIVRTVGDPKTPFFLQAGHREAKVTLDAGATMAVRVELERTPGSDPETSAAQAVVDVFAEGNGKVNWEETGAPALQVAAPGQRRLGQPAAKAPATSSPQWIMGEEVSPAEQLGLEELKKKLQGDLSKNLFKGLMELEVHRRDEVKTLAYRSLIAMDRFDAAVAALNNRLRRQSWEPIMADLRRAVARGPQTAKAIRESFEELRNDDATALYRMLWGYSLEDLTTGKQAEKLVEHLDHEDLDFRVMANWNLTDITGKRDIFYRPDFSADQRETYSRKWRTRLESGQIVPKK